MDAQPRNCYDQLDTQFQGEEDFLDTTFINEGLFLQRFLSPVLLMKMFNGHEKSVDEKVKFRNEDQKYGTETLSDNRSIAIPGVLDVKVAIGETDGSTAGTTSFAGGYDLGVRPATKT